MFQTLADFTRAPEPFSVYSAPDLWADAHISSRMLKAHLDPNNDLASRCSAKIDAAVEWIDQLLALRGKRVCDLGCGPGLYTTKFFDRGAQVTGLDVSANSLKHAVSMAEDTGRSIEYLEADYTHAELPGQMEVYTLIFCDYCALSPIQRSSLLSRVHSALVPGGHLVLDVYSLPAFTAFEERAVVASRLMDGFWSSSDYVGMMKSFRYEEHKISLERYLIVEPDREWAIYNWLQYFSEASLKAELQGAGFRVRQLAGSLAGEPYTEDADLLAVVARAA